MYTSHEIQQQVNKYVDALPKIGVHEIKAGQVFAVTSIGYSRYFGCKPNPLWTAESGLLEMYTCGFVANPSKAMLIGYVPGSAHKVQFRKTFHKAKKDRCVVALVSREDIEFIRRKFEEMDRSDRWHEGHTKRARDIHAVWNYASDPSTNPATPNETHEGFVIEVYDGIGNLKNRSRMICTVGDPVNAGNEIENMVRGYAAAYFCHCDVANGAKFQITYAPEID